MLSTLDSTAHDAAWLSATGLGAGPAGRPLFAGLNLHLAAGEALFIAGPNGAGKTTLLRILAGLADPAQGRVARPAHAVSYIGHAPALTDDLSAAENLKVAAHVAGLSVSDDSVRRALARFGVATRTHLPARALSQGQRRRAVLARLALTSAPGVLLLDEPFNALDEASGEVLAEVLAERLAQGAVLAYTTHQPRRLAARRHHTVRLGVPAMQEAR
jgi:heme exporter protein A